MAVQFQFEPLRADVAALGVLRRRHLVFLAGAGLCLISAWYFALVIAPSALGVSTPTIQQGLLPEWVGCREILHGRDPYRREIIRQIGLDIHGKTITATAPANQHRFAYPVSFIFLFFPIALLPFKAAQIVMLAACVVSSAMSVFLWGGRRRLGKIDQFIVVTLLFASYPVVLGLQLRQPTLIVAALLALAVYCIQSGRLLLAGIVAALSASKPHLAIAILLPLAIWSVASWRTRKTFFQSLSVTLLAFLLASELIVPGWLAGWLDTLRAYSHYAGAKPLLADLLRGHFVLPSGAFLIVAVIWVSLEFHASDLLFVISFSVVTFQLLFPFQIYNEVLLLPAALWAVMNTANIRKRGQLHVLLFGCAWTALASGWAASVALSLWDIAAPGSGVKLWQLPLVAAWLYPMLLFVALATFGASGLLARYQTLLSKRTTG